MSGTITANPNPYSVDLGPLGKTYITGAVTGLAFTQSNAVPQTAGITPTLPNGFSGNKSNEADISNGMVAIQKTDGQLQYFLMAGVYTFPTVGVPYLDASHANSALFGPLPEAFLKWQPTDALSIEAGKLPTLIGQEATFTFENLNIERGLLWNQENLINRGMQVNYTLGPVALAVSWNDGYYSNRFTYVTGSAVWTVDSANTLVVAGGGNTSKSPVVSNPTLATYPSTPEPQEASTQFDVSWTWTGGPWSINPYFQWTHAPAVPLPIGTSAGSTYGGAVLVGYTFDSAAMLGDMSLNGFSVGGRFEYIGSTGNPVTGPNLLGYGIGSNAWDITVTPTYQYKIFFVRTELSYVDTGSTHLPVTHLGFGTFGTKSDQVRGLLEAGFVF